MGDYPSVTDQNIFISTNLQSTLLVLFLIGIYSGVYAGAWYTHFEHNAARSRVIIGVISALYAVILGQGCIQWYYINFTLVTKGASRLSLFFFSATNPSRVCIILSNILETIGMVLADGLLMWRCFHACSRSWRRISIPLFLYGLEFAMGIADITFEGLLTLRPTLDTYGRGQGFDILDGSLDIVAVVISVLATSIIGWNIRSSTRRHGTSSRRHEKILDIFIQTSSIYSLSILANTICVFRISSDSSAVMIAVINYCYSFNIIITGLAPTLMVARLAQNKDEQEVFSFQDTGHQFITYSGGQSSTPYSGEVPTNTLLREYDNVEIARETEVV